MATTTPSFHIFVLVHGNNGEPYDWRYTIQALRAEFDQIGIINSRANEGKKTLVGIEIAGTKLANEVIPQIKDFGVNANGEWIENCYLSVLCHSLGGLIARYALPFILEETRVTPVSFVTLCSPHLGSRRPGGTWLKAAWKFAVHSVLENLYQQTGYDLLLGGNIEDAILHKISLPESKFMKALATFKYRTLVAITHYDLSVPFSSAAVTHFNPYPVPSRNCEAFYIAGTAGFSEEHLADMPKALFQKELDNVPAPDLTTPWLADNCKEVSFNAGLYKNLHTLEWRRLDVQFGATPGMHVHDAPLELTRTFLHFNVNQGSLAFRKVLMKILRRDHSFSTGGWPVEKEVASVLDAIIK